MIRLVNSRLSRAALLLCGSALALASYCMAAKLSPYDKIYVFGDSFSDIGEGYLDGNGPTAVAYLAERLGFPLMRANDPSAAGKSLDFAISGAKTGSGSGVKIEGALLGVGMRNQVDDFAARVRSHIIAFDPETTLFFLAGGLNDQTLPTAETIANLEGDISQLYEVGGRRFMVALMPTKIPGYNNVGVRLNPELVHIPQEIKHKFPGSNVTMSRWGPFYDEVFLHPRQYGIENTTLQCAGRSIHHEDTTPCPNPAAYFYYHQNHPSTTVHKIVGDKLYDEVMGLTVMNAGRAP